MSNTAPLITVYMPTHNRLALLQRAVASIQSQTFTDFEAIIVDDGSSDKTADYLQALSEKDKRFRFFRHENPRGACAARNLAIEAARGQYITGIDDDDEFLPTRLEYFVENINDDYAFLFAPIIWDFGVRKKVMRSPVREIDLNTLLSANYVGNQVFVKTERLRDIDGFDECMPACQDWDTWIRLSERFGVGFCLEAATYLVHSGHEMERISTSPSKIAGHAKIIQKFAKISSKENQLCQTLALKKAEGKPLPTSILLRSFKTDHHKLFFRYWVASRYKWIYRLYQLKWT
ncbi:glycosyltransferase [Lacimicrobium sp. SS2-24]|uniref:glycosyltransferase n=1 Tax=Lacimicrobium sp. SS2-24 TaxID=2005569 RepID=UPI000B4A67DD|nr:glycosyltransferase [Lacimicrobium sp. SS2-24]